MSTWSKSQIIFILSLPAFIFFTVFSEAQELSGKDTIRIAEAYQIADKVQEYVWPGWKAAPFTTLLVTSEYEYLIRAASKPDGFAELGWNKDLHSKVYFRNRTFDPKLLATFPAFGESPVIVIGSAENTGKNSTAWVLTLLHEHFHQLQMSDPDYYRQVEALGLAGDDKTGMWMLNYAFPYDSPEINKICSSLSLRLTPLLLGSINASEADAFWREYATLEKSLNSRDFKYLSFQLWQEGIARFIELRAAEAADKIVKPSAQFSKLADFESFSEAAKKLRVTMLSELQSAALKEQKRVAFYPLGAAIGLLLDQTNPQWKRRYFKEKFALEKYAAGM